MEEEEQQKGHGADLSTGVILMLISLSMLAYTLATMPMFGSYAGVTNAWYVSPALLPIFVSVSLALLSMGLTLRSWRKGGLDAVRRALAPGVAALYGSNAALLAAAVAIVVFVAGYLPRVDFVVTTITFMFAVTLCFHGQDGRFNPLIFGVYVLGGLALWVLALFGVQTGIRTGSAFLLDGIVLAVTLGLMGLAMLGAERGERRPIWQCVWVSILVAFVLTAVFKFGLRVPMPREGLVIDLMDQIRLGLWRMI